jgi:hypothetical protein
LSDCDKKIKYFVIRRNEKHLGLFSYVITNCGNTFLALRKGKIPVIDMCSYKNPYLPESKVGIINAWEQYFEQPYNVGLNDINYNDC